MEIQIFGKTSCGKCEAAKKKVAFFIEKWGLAEHVPVKFVDMETVDGRAEGAFYDVGSRIPVILVLDGGSERGRWDTEIQDSNELRRALGLA